MRTTLNLEDDAQEALARFAAANHLSRGQDASELIRRGTRYKVKIRMVDGLPIFDLPPDFPRITDEDVKKTLEDE